MTYAIALSWESHRRTEGLAEGLNLPLFALQHNGSRYTRYLCLTIRTIRLLGRLRPKVVLFQNPSLVLALLLLVLRPVLGQRTLVMDAHNEAIRPFTFSYWPIRVMSKLAVRYVDLTVVTNSALKMDVMNMGGTALVVPDRLPSPPFPIQEFSELPQIMRVIVVASFAADEPICEIVEAARLLGPDYHFSITGRESKCPQSVRATAPSNVHFTGFLSDSNYWRLMNESHLVLDLTLKPDCIVCGAYEALSLRRPMVLSDNAATAELFGDAAVLCTANNARQISIAIETARREWSTLVRRVHAASEGFHARWLVRVRPLAAILDDDGQT